jgi:hypothetical protein
VVLGAAVVVPGALVVVGGALVVVGATVVTGATVVVAGAGVVFGGTGVGTGVGGTGVGFGGTGVGTGVGGTGVGRTGVGAGVGVASHLRSHTFFSWLQLVGLKGHTSHLPVVVLQTPYTVAAQFALHCASVCLGFFGPSTHWNGVTWLLHR